MGRPTMDSFPDAAVLATALGCGLVGGVFFAFSTFVMDGLAELAPAQGIAAMQSINRTAISPLFMLALFVTAAGCLGLIVWAGVSWGQPRAPWMLAGGALYLAGTIVVTMAANVPRNDRLAKLDPHGVDAAERWATYVSEWTTWNHVRTAAGLGAAALLMIALVVGSEAS